VGTIGLEPTLLSEPEPKSGASAISPRARVRQIHHRLFFAGAKGKNSALKFSIPCFPFSGDDEITEPTKDF
jgi:hypothetical protein